MEQRHKGDFWKWRKTRCSLSRGCAHGKGLLEKVRGGSSGWGRLEGPAWPPLQGEFLGVFGEMCF